MLFPLDAGTGFCFVNTRPIETMWLAQNWKSGLRMCAHIDTMISVKLVSHCQWLSLRISYPLSSYEGYFTTKLNTYTQTYWLTCKYTCTHTHTHMTQLTEYLSWNCTVKRKGKWLTSHLSLPFLISSCLWLSLHMSLYSRFTALEPFSHIPLHLFPLWFSATHPLLAPLSHSTPCHSPPHPPFLFFFPVAMVIDRWSDRGRHQVRKS